jgi:hypothetical protein
MKAPRDVSGLPPVDTLCPQNLVTRFEVIDHTKGGQGRLVVRYGVAVALIYQDGGRTLKVLLTDK